MWRENRVNAVDIWDNSRYGSISLVPFSSTQESKVLPCQTLLVLISTAHESELAIHSI